MICSFFFSGILLYFTTNMLIAIFFFIIKIIGRTFDLIHDFLFRPDENNYTPFDVTRPLRVIPLDLERSQDGEKRPDIATNDFHSLELCRLRDDKGKIACLEMTEDGQQCVGTTHDGGLYLWDLGIITPFIKSSYHRTLSDNVSGTYMKILRNTNFILVPSKCATDVEIFEMTKDKQILRHGTIINSNKQRPESRIKKIVSVKNPSVIINIHEDGKFDFWNLGSSKRQLIETRVGGIKEVELTHKMCYAFIIDGDLCVSQWKLFYNQEDWSFEIKLLFRFEVFHPISMDLSLDNGHFLILRAGYHWQSYLVSDKLMNPTKKCKLCCGGNDSTSLIKISSDNSVVVVAVRTTLQYYSFRKKKLLGIIQLAGNDGITDIHFLRQDLCLALILGGEIRIFMNKWVVEEQKRIYLESFQWILTEGQALRYDNARRLIEKRLEQIVEEEKKNKMILNSNQSASHSTFKVYCPWV